MGRDRRCPGCGELIRFRTIDDIVRPLGCKCRRNRTSRSSNYRSRTYSDFLSNSTKQKIEQHYPICLGHWSFLRVKNINSSLTNYICSECKRYVIEIKNGDNSFWVERIGSNIYSHRCKIAYWGESQNEIKLRNEIILENFEIIDPKINNELKLFFSLIPLITFILYCYIIHQNGVDLIAHFKNKGATFWFYFSGFMLLLIYYNSDLNEKYKEWSYEQCIPNGWPVRKRGFMPNQFSTIDK